MPFSIGKSAHTLTYNEKTDLNSIIKKINRGPCTIKVKTAEDAAQITRQLIDAALTPNDLSLATLLKNTSIQVNGKEPKSIVELLNSHDLADCKASLQEKLGAFITYAATKEAHEECVTLLAKFKKTDIRKRKDELKSDRESTYYPEMKKTLDLSVIQDLEQLPFDTLQELFPEAISDVLSTDPNLMSTRCEFITSLLDRFGDNLAKVAGVYREPGTAADYRALESALMISDSYERLTANTRGFDLDKTLAGYIKKELVAATLFTDEIISDLLAGKIDEAIITTAAIPEPKQSLIQKVLSHFREILVQSRTLAESYKDASALATAVFAIVNSPRKASIVTPMAEIGFSKDANTFLATLIDSSEGKEAGEVGGDADVHAACASGGGKTGSGSEFVSELRAVQAQRGLAPQSHGLEVSSATQTSTGMPANVKHMPHGIGPGPGFLEELATKLEERRSTTPTDPNEGRPNTADSTVSKESGDSGIVVENWVEITPPNGKPYDQDTNYENGDWVRIKQKEGKDTEPYYWNTNTVEVAEEDPRQSSSTDA